MSWWWIFTVLEWLIRLAMLVVILRRRFMPATALAWISLVLFLPGLGLVVYLLVGENYLGRRRVKLRREMVAAMDAPLRAGSMTEYAEEPRIEAGHEQVVLQAQTLSGFAILGGNQVEFLEESEAVIGRLIEDVEGAREHVHLLMYIFSSDETGRRVGEALVRARERGVACRVMADAAGSRQFFRGKGLGQWLGANGVKVVPLLPAAPLRRRLARLDLRNHRKLAVIDGRVAYAGSQNIVNADYGRRGLRWLDLTGRFVGPVVGQLQVVFLEDWVFETGEELKGEDLFPALKSEGGMFAQAIPTGPTHEAESLPRVLLSALHSAKRKVVITSPYLVPDEATMLALAMAAERGVEVNLVVPRKSDHPLVLAAGRAYFETLMESGVRIYSHETGLLHAKTMTVDDSFALLGSSNLDVRSFYLNFELNVLMYGEQITRELRFAQGRYLNESVLIDLEEWRKRPVVRRYLEQMAALLSPLL